jgi:hypothetical protein
METFTFTVTEYELGKPWITLGTSTRTIDASSHAAFWKEAEKRFPKDRFEVTPMIGQGF